MTSPMTSLFLFSTVFLSLEIFVKSSTSSRTADPFRITGLLGSGWNGLVFKSVLLATNEEFAMKVPFGLGPDGADSEWPNFLFHNELEVLFSLEQKVQDTEMRLRLPLLSTRFPQPFHFNGSTSILSNLSSDIEQLLLGRKLKAMIFPLYEGGDLQTFLWDVEAGRRSLRYMDVCNLAIGIARALQAVHSASYVHLDLKPANILLDSSRPIPGSDIGQPVLVDFGLATKSDLVVPSFWGSSGYMAPELGDQSLTGAEDVFSFGSILYELLSGRAIGHEEMHKNQEEFWNVESPDPTCLIGRCWSKDPQQRPTLMEIIEELESAKRDVGVF